MLSEYPRCTKLALPDKLRLTAFEAEDRLPAPRLDAIQRAADLLEEIGWAVQPSGWPTCGAAATDDAVVTAPC